MMSGQGEKIVIDFSEQAVRQIAAKAAVARQFFDAHDMLADEVKDRMHLDDLEVLLREIRRLQEALDACRELRSYDRKEIEQLRMTATRTHA